MATKRVKVKHFELLPKEEAIKQINDLISNLMSEPDYNKNDSFIRDLKAQRDELKKK